jgi:hypothetical protein
VVSGAPGSGIVQVAAEAELENDFDIAGVEFDWWFRDLNLFGLYLPQSDDDPRGTGGSIDTDAWFAEANYTAPVADRCPALTARRSRTSRSSRSEDPAVPGAGRGVHGAPNVKFTLEAQMRLDLPRQGHDPTSWVSTSASSETKITMRPPSSIWALTALVAPAAPAPRRNGAGDGAEAPRRRRRLPSTRSPARHSRLPPRTREIDQENMVFEPHVLPVLVGTTVDFSNSDALLHNVFSPDK